MERSSDRPGELLAQYSEVLADLSGVLAAPAEQDTRQAEEGLGLPASPGNDEPPASASSPRPQRRRRPQRPTGAEPGDGEAVEAPEARMLASQASGEDSGPPASSLPAVNGDECRPRLPAFDQQRIATMRGLIAGVEETVEALQAVACELRALSERLGGASRPTGRERLALENQAQA